MNGSLKRPFVVALLLVFSLVLSAVATPHRQLSQTRPVIELDTAVPKRFGDWRVDPNFAPLPLSPDQASLLSEVYDQVLSRTYINSHGERIMLSISYGSKQTQQLRAHRQEVCYHSQGFQINRLRHEDIPVAGAMLPVTRMVAQRNSRIEPVTYWFTTGDTVVMSYWDREWAQFRYAMSGYIPDGYLVRISNISGQADASFKEHIAFADALFAHVDPELRRRLVGHR